MGRVALDRMPVDAVDISARRQQFVPIAILTLGNAGTATDGFDEMFSEAAQHAAEHLGFAESLEPDLKDADFVPGQIVESALGPTARDFQAFTGAGSSVLDGATGAASGTPLSGAQPAPGTLSILDQTRARLAGVGGLAGLDPKEPVTTQLKSAVLNELKNSREG